MSGLDIAGLALPLIIDAIKSYRLVYEKIHIYRNWSKEVERIRARFLTQREFFLNECHLLLLTTVEDDVSAKAMLDDLSHSNWTDSALIDRMDERLSKSRRLGILIMKSTQEALEEIRLQLKVFDEISENRIAGEPFFDTILRVRHRIKLSFNKTVYEAKLAQLRDNNEDLAQLRSYVNDFRAQSRDPCRCVSRPKLPSRYFAVREASQKFYEALQNQWICEDSAHITHYAALCLDAELQEKDCVRLDVAIAYRQTNSPEKKSDGCQSESPLWLCVQSAKIESEAAKSAIYHSSSAGFCTRHRTREIMEQSPQHEDDVLEAAGSSIRELEPSHATVPRKKRRGDEVAYDSMQSDISPRFPRDFQEVTCQLIHRKPETINLNLGSAKNLCQFFKHQLKNPVISSPAHCIGFLETASRFKHSFYAPDPTHSRYNYASREECKNKLTLEGFIKESLQDSVTIVDQLNIARRMAEAVLMYRSTPWLKTRWRLRDLSLFHNSDNVSLDALTTLHLSGIFPGCHRSVSLEPMDVTAADVLTNGEISDEDVRNLYGISNMTMFCLGMALLELSHWRAIEDLCRSKDVNEMATARRLADSRSPLGSRYQEIVRRCLKCDFGFGDDLGRPELQSAVYGSVICELNDMAVMLSVDDIKVH